MEDSPSPKTLPNDTGAEQAFLGALLIDPSAINTAITLLKPGDFYSSRNHILYEAILQLYNLNNDIDNVTLSSYLKDNGLLEKSGGIGYINQLLEMTPTSVNLDNYAKIVRDKAILRSLLKVTGEIRDEVFSGSREIDEIINLTESKIFDITDRNLSETHENIQGVIKKSIKIIQSYKDGTNTGLSTGFSGFDKITSGLQGGQLIIIAGRPGTGKTAFCLNMAVRIGINTRRPVLIFSLEMQKEELVLRMLCSEAKVDNTRLRQGMVNKREMNNIVHAADLIYNTQIVIDDKPDINVMEAKAKARRVKNEKGDLALIIIDYMQLMDGPPDIPRNDRYNIISHVSRSLKYLAKEMDVPVIALSQLSRKVEDRTSGIPMLSDLRESGSIEQDADLVAFISRDIYATDEEEKNKAELLIRKNRNAAVGEVPLLFFGQYTRFEDRTGG
ncbi:MAG: replicative DNA helicase [Spirochaetes bacterium]|nr:replicative DNA helicase [Spirochaetota bacterium]